MSRFVLQPCRVRDDYFVPTKGEAQVEVNWPELAKRLAPTKEPTALRTLLRLQVGGFVGVRKAPGHAKPTNFFLMNPDRSGKLGWILKQNPKFGEQVESVFRVEIAEYDASTTEQKGSPDKLGPAKFDPSKAAKSVGMMV